MPITAVPECNEIVRYFFSRTSTVISFFGNREILGFLLMDVLFVQWLIPVHVVLIFGSSVIPKSMRSSDKVIESDTQKE
jgi:hypothetical protein